MKRIKVTAYVLWLLTWAGCLSSTLTLSVMVQDMNDNAPKFEKEIDEIDVDERLPRGTQILPLNARDLDKGKNSCLIYTIILQKSGIIFLKNTLDREKIESLSLRVMAEDQ